MTASEFSTFSAAIKTYFPKENVLPTKESMTLWYSALKDIPHDVASAALMQYVQTNKFAPTIAELREIATTIQSGNLPDWGEAWEKTLSAIREYGMYNEKDALASLDDLTRLAVKRLGYHDLCISENMMQDRANFRMIFEQLLERKTKEQKISPVVKKMIANIRGDMPKETKTLTETEFEQKRSELLKQLAGI